MSYGFCRPYNTIISNMPSSNEYKVGLTESEVINLRSLDMTYAFEYQRKANDTWKFNYKMLRYDKSWETFFPVCLCKEMVEEILSWCSIYDLRFLFPKLALGLRLRLFRLPREDKKIVSPVCKSMYHKKRKVMENALDIAEFQFKSNRFTLRKMVLLGQYQDDLGVEGRSRQLAQQFNSSLTNILNEKHTTTYEEVVEGIPEQYRWWFISREAFVIPLFAELTDLYKRPLDWGIEYEKFYTGCKLKEDNHSPSKSWRTKNSFNLYRSPLLVLMSLDTKDRTQKDYNMEALETYFTTNRIRYYCRGVLKGEGWDKFPKTWSAKKYITYLMKYQGI